MAPASLRPAPCDCVARTCPGWGGVLALASLGVRGAPLLRVEVRVKVRVRA